MLHTIYPLQMKDVNQGALPDPSWWQDCQDLGLPGLLNTSYPREQTLPSSVLQGGVETRDSKP